MTPREADDKSRWLRETLDDAVADVEPRHDLDDVRARLDQEAVSARRRTGWAAAAAGLAVAATVATVALATGTGGEEEPDAGPAGSPSVASTAGSEGSGPTPSDDGTVTSSDGPVAVYFVGDTPVGPRLFREFLAPEGAGDELSLAVGMAVTSDPLDPDYRNPWPAGTNATASYDEGQQLLTVDVRGSGTDLHDRPAGTSDDEARMALEQLMYTAQAAVQARPPVRLLLDGEVTDQLLGEPASEPLAQGDPMQVQAPVWIITPQDGAAMDVLRVEGRGAFFEANVSWQVLDGDRVVEEGFATAAECCSLAPYSFEVPDLPPGDYVLRVYDADMSGGEGPGEHEDTKAVTITQ